VTGAGSSSPWPYAPELLDAELAQYLGDAAAPAVQSLVTRCPPWTVREITVHLTCTFSRFHDMLRQGRAGDFTPPFEPGQLTAENLRAVDAHQGDDPCGELRAVVTGFRSALRDGQELMPHQLGPIPVALQVLFGINELAIHHDDVAAAAGQRYQPPPRTLAVLVSLWQRRAGPDVTAWPEILRTTGRTA
jgi:uncharacterized protein (TIGR03083 family)